MLDTINPIRPISQTMLALLMQVHIYEELNMRDVCGMLLACNMVLNASEQVMNIVDK